MSGQNPALYALSANMLNGETIHFSHLAGRVLLIVNTASKCGFTPQYAALQQLHSDYYPRGLTVLAFPSNQFGNQEPGSAAEIAQFCECAYRVTFPVFARTDVNGPHAHPLFKLLTNARRGFFGTRRIKWNFTKFLVDRNGNVVARYSPSTNPLKLRDTIEPLLNNS
ncbi:MAG TPA: glutathione peroxidase [Terracidiphilus sp.]